MKKILSLVLSICLVLSVSSTLPFSATGAEVQDKGTGIVSEDYQGDYEYELIYSDTGDESSPDEVTGTPTAKIIKYNGSDNSLSMPTVIDGYKITSIGEGAFKDKTCLMKVDTPMYTKTIEKYAFQGCKNLTNVTLYRSLESIGDYAFADCTSLVSADYISSNLNWENVAIGEGNTCLTDSYINFAFIQERVGDFEFEKVNNVTARVIKYYGSDSVLSIPSEIDGYTVTRISGNAFNNCTNLTKVTLPDELDSIIAYAFDGCINLKEITIPNTLTYIGGNAFRNCTSLTDIYYNGSNKDWNGIYIDSDNACLTDANIHLDCIYNKNEEYEYIKYPDGTAKVIDYLGSDSAITIPSQIEGYTVTNVGKDYFDGFKNVTEITIPNTVTTIDNGAFDWCTDLVEVNIPNSVTKIGICAFRWCKNLKNITLPSNLKCIAGSTFDGCTALTGVTIPKGVTEIADDAFTECSNLQTITIPNSVTDIGKRAFSKCKSLLSIDIPKGVTSIKRDTFDGCENLINVTIPDSVTSIGLWAFFNCKRLTSVTLPKNLTTIDANVFGECTRLSDIKIDKNNEKYYSLDGDLYDKSTDTLVQYAIGKEDKEFVIPDSIKAIGEDAFYGSPNLTSVIIPKGITKIQTHTFDDCKNLTQVVIPRSVKKIYYWAFDNCTNLKDVYYEGYVFEWQKIKPESGNDPLKNATIHYNAVSAVKLSETKTSLNIGETVTLKADLETDSVVPKTVIWTSSDESVATVTDGVVTALKTGTATITATSDYSSAQCVVTVTQPVSGVKLSKTSTAIYNGKTTTLKATVSPSDANNKAVSWKSSNTKIATVTQNGVVKGIKPGTVAITATSKDGTNKSAVCIITVKAQKATKITLSKKSVTLAKKGKSATVKVTLSPSNTYNKNIAVTTSNKKVAKISSSKITSGKTVKITAVKRGSAKIKFTAKDGSKKSAICKVTVKK